MRRSKALWRRCPRAGGEIQNQRTSVHMLFVATSRTVLKILLCASPEPRRLASDLCGAAISFPMTRKVRSVMPMYQSMIINACPGIDGNPAFRLLHPLASKLFLCLLHVSVDDRPEHQPVSAKAEEALWQSLRTLYGCRGTASEIRHQQPQR